MNKVRRGEIGVGDGGVKKELGKMKKRREEEVQIWWQR